MEDMRKNLFYEQKNGYDLISTEDHIAMEDYCRDYMNYIDISRTEREAVVNAIEEAEEHGFVEYVPGMELKPGMKIYQNNRGRALHLAVIGSRSLAEGVHIAGAHVDAPRLDLKQVPLYESDEMAYFKTHYYGGIKKYQWVTVPLELHGIVCTKSGEDVEVVIGRDPEDPKFVITDLLPHLAQDQMQKTLANGFSGENLNILIGSTPYADEGKDRVKLAIMSLLNDMYGIVEEDFISAELVAVPAYDVSEIGFDRGLIGAYGHDDRVCAYAELKAIMELENPEHTCICILSDKEEVGSDGVSGMQSAAFDCFMEDLCEAQGVKLRRCYENSKCISADVTAAFDPCYAEVSDKRNAAKVNYGLGLAKFTGQRGKYGTNDAFAELVGYFTRLFNNNAVTWQMAELGKVDQGGGGTIAKFMSKRNIDTIDAGVPVLSMHAPFEVVSKFDCFMTYKGIKAFYAD